MFIRVCYAVIFGVVLSLQFGCAAPPPIVKPPTPTLFPRTPVVADTKTPGRVALLVPPEVQVTWASLAPKSDFVRLQAGPMVQQALLLALGDGLQGGVQLVTDLPPPSSGFDATLVLRSVQLEYRFGWWFLPTPGVSSTSLAFDMNAVDAQGRTAWTRYFQDERDYSYLEGLLDYTEGATYTQQRLAHEAAWRLSQQVLHDLRGLLESERMKARAM